MFSEVEYTGSTINTNGMRERLDFDNYLEAKEGECVIIVSSFEDLKEAFERVFTERSDVICLSNLAILEILSLLERVICGNELINIFFISYENMETAKRNMINRCPSFENIEHLLAFSVARRYEQLKSSQMAAFEVIFDPLRYYRLFDHNLSKIDFIHVVRKGFKIHLIELRG